jgi:hypothetical protein
LYVASLGDGKIVQLNCDGTDQKDFLADLPPPRQLAVDVENRKLYWSSNSEPRIDRVNLDGSGREPVVKNMPGVAFGMALDVKTDLLGVSGRRHLSLRARRLGP